jgi:hypothetical protein
VFLAPSAGSDPCSLRAQQSDNIKSGRAANHRWLCSRETPAPKAAPYMDPCGDQAANTLICTCGHAANLMTFVFMSLCMPLGALFTACSLRALALTPWKQPQACWSNMQSPPAPSPHRGPM